MIVLLCLGFEVEYPFDRCYEEVEYEEDLSTLVRRIHAQQLPDVGPSLVVLHPQFNHLYLAERFDYWVHDYKLELHLRRHAGGHLLD